LGFSVLPLHFYSSIPNIRELRRRTDWREPRSMHGINFLSTDKQITLLREVLSARAGDASDPYVEAVAQNGVDGGYGIIEAHVLAAFVASRKPARVVQVGCGVSTAVMLSAARSAGYRPETTCIDPFPTEYLRHASSEGAITLLAKPAQLVEIDTFTSLGAGDLLFVDSTHTVKPGSEVNRIVLEVLPRLQRGVLVHFHDIYFPYEYSRGFLSRDLFFPGETSLLYAFLLNNPTFRIDLCLSMLHYAVPDALKALLPNYEPQGNDAGLAAGDGLHFPSAIYLSKMAD
jgi:predicted O-methyltransferase YrrM